MNKPRVLGIGASVVDHIIRVSDTYVQSLKGGKGGSIAINFNALEKILFDCKGNKALINGGSCLNTIKGLAQLNINCAFFGKIGKDPMGSFFTNALKDQTIDATLIQTEHPTSQIVCLVTPDGERTMRFFPGATATLNPKDITEILFKDKTHLHLEGYNLLQKGVAEKALAMAKHFKMTTSLDLSSYELVTAKKNIINKLLKEYVDIVIANADEAWALLGLPPEKACHQLKKACQIAVVLFGEGGCWVGNNDQVLHGPPFKAEPVDTTGAGDLFCSGFLFGFLHHKEISECARIGALLGSSVIEALGAEIPPVKWQKILSSLANDGYSFT